MTPYIPSPKMKIVGIEQKAEESIKWKDAKIMRIDREVSTLQFKDKIFIIVRSAHWNLKVKGSLYAKLIRIMPIKTILILDHTIRITYYPHTLILKEILSLKF